MCGIRGMGRKEVLIVTEAASERVFIRADEMTQQVQGLATKADDLSLILGIRMMEERMESQTLPPHLCCDVVLPPKINICNKIDFNYF